MHSEYDIAIIGMSCRMPGARDTAQFWHNLRHGVESITFLDGEPIDRNDLLDQPHRVNAGGNLADVDMFDASFFGISEGEAALMDPQHRLFLECAWEAFEDAGYDTQSFDGPVGVFAGTAINSYLLNQVLPSVHPSTPRSLLEDARDLRILLANGAGFLPTRVSYKLDLTGPSVQVQSGCSTGLVALHLACQSLLAGECDMALAGAATVRVPSDTGHLFEPGMIFSPDGHCRAFSAQAQGTVLADGVGVVVLKRRGAAAAAGDGIRAVIKSSAINNDGATKVGYAAPSVQGQAAIVAQALSLAEIDATTVRYVEAHGTGTAQGDPVEVAALTEAFRQHTRPGARNRFQYCGLGSVKSNIGHALEAAGLAGLIKTVLALEHRYLPPTLHASVTSGGIDFAQTPFYVQAEPQEWPAGETPRRAGVSAFGMGGTNAHVILEEAQKVSLPKHAVHEPSNCVLTLSARSSGALRHLVQRYSRWVDQNNPEAIVDVCYTTNVGRRHFEHRLAIVAGSTEELKAQLASWEGHSDAGRSGMPGGQPAATFTSSFSGSPGRRVAFLYTGQGADYRAMGQQLYRTQPVYRQALDRCEAILRERDELRQPLHELLACVEPREERSRPCVWLEPALLALGYALTEMWGSWGIRPDIVLGHGLGEYGAACASGVMCLEDGLLLLARRGRLMQSTEPGMMAAVSASDCVLAELISELHLEQAERRISLAAIDGPRHAVISGRADYVRMTCEACAARNIGYSILNASRAFHSPLIEPCLPDLERAAQRIPSSRPRMCWISTVTGQVVDERVDPGHWIRHARQPVRFADAMSTLDGLGVDVVVEIGFGPSLSGRGRDCLTFQDPLWIPSLQRQSASNGALFDDWRGLITGLAQLYVRGFEIDWSRVHEGIRRSRQHLPTYPFERQRHWIGPGPAARDEPGVAPASGPRTAAPSGQLAECSTGRRLYDSPAPSEVASLIRFSFQRRIDQPCIRAYQRALSDLDAIGREFVVVALESMGWQFRPSERFSTADMAEALSIVHFRWLERLLRLLADANILQLLNPYHGGTSTREWRVVSEPAVGDPQAALSSLSGGLVNAEVRLLAHCGPMLASALQGRQSPVGGMFAGGDSSMVADFYRQSPVLQAANATLRDSVEILIALMPVDRPVRILEVGAGTGVSTAFLLPTLPSHRTEYVFTDVEPSFLDRARQRFQSYPFVKYATLDVEDRLGARGLAADNFDIVIAANVVHATRDVAESLRNLGRLLRPSGLLLLVEGTSPACWLDVIFGASEGWWRFSDRALRPDHPLLSAEVWRALLGDLGFCDAVALPSAHDAPKQSMLSQTLLISRASTASLPLPDDPRRPASDAEPPIRVRLDPCDRDWHTYVMEQVGHVLGTKPHGKNDRPPSFQEFSEMGIDSIEAIELRSRLQRDLGLSLPQTLIYDYPTVDALADHLVRTLGARRGFVPEPAGTTGRPTSICPGPSATHTNDHLVTIQPHGSRKPFFCVPGALGDPAQFGVLARLLGRDQPFHSFRPPLGQTYAPLSFHIEDLAEGYVAAVRSVQPVGPYQVGGHSFGGLVAMEMAQQLLGRGETVSSLVVMDMPMPAEGSLRRRFRLQGELSVSDLAVLLSRILGVELAPDPSGFAGLGARQQSEHLSDRLRQAGWPFSSGDLERMRSVLRASYQALAAFRPRVRHAVPIRLFRAAERDPRDSFLPDPQATKLDPKWGWSPHCDGPMRIEVVPGNHLTMMCEPHVRVLGQSLKLVLCSTS